MEALAEQADGDTEALLERWQGHPERIAEDLFRTRDMETGEMEPVNLFYPYQPKLMHAYFYGDESITNVYKGRRIGVSWIFMVCITIDGLTTPDANFAVVSRTQSQSEERLSDMEDLLENSRLGINPDDWLEKNNQAKKIFPNGATVRAFSGDPDAARGMDSAKTVFVDEMAFLEDQEATMQAFMPFINLGSHRQMLQVSTPKVSNDLFLDTHERGSPTGADGVISVKQPSFKNPEEIDIEQSLHEQDVEPVRPDMDVATVEAERAQDPQGFAQEYLCRPIADEYRFFTKEGIFEAMKRGAAHVEGGELHGKYTGWSPATHARNGGQMVMGVDIGIDRDDTAIAVFEHSGKHRHLRFHTLLDRQDLMAIGLSGHRPDDPSAVADYIYCVVKNMGIDHVFLDKTGPGKGFQKEVEKRIGRKAHGFNFSDKEEIARMMGDFNYALHNDLITLVPDSSIKGQLEAIVKEQRHETSKPRFSGKKHAPDGKDDLAMALVLGAYPPNFNAERQTTPEQRENVSEPDPEEVTDEDDFRGIMRRDDGQTTPASSSESPWGTQNSRTTTSSFNFGTSDRRTETDYEPRHPR